MNFLRALLIASLALNVFLAGWWVGDMTSSRPPGMPPFPRPMNFAERLTSSLSQDGQARVGEQLRQIDAIIRQGFESRDAQFGQLRALAGASEFDRARFSEILSKVPELRLDNERAQWAQVIAVFSQLDQNDRAALAQVLFMPPSPPRQPDNGPPGPPLGERPLPPDMR